MVEMTKSWIVTLVPLIIYLISFGYSVQSGHVFTPEQNAMLTNIFYGFLGSATVGGAVGISKVLKK